MNRMDERSSLNRDIQKQVMRQSWRDVWLGPQGQVPLLQEAAVAVFGLDGSLLGMNAQMSVWCGLASEQIGNLQAADVYATGSRPPGDFLVYWARALDGMDQFFDWNIRNSEDGIETPVEISMQRIALKEKEAVLIRLNLITRRRQFEKNLLMTQFAMDRAPDSILWVDDEGGLVYANEMACSTTGYTREELLGMSVFDIDPDFPRELWEEHKGQMRIQGRMRWESRHKTKAGDIFPVEVTSNYFEYENRFIACAFDRDITERRRVQKELQESEERSRRQRAAVVQLATDEAIFNGELPQALRRVAEVVSAAIEVERVSIWVMSENDTQLQCQTLYQATPGTHSAGMTLLAVEFPHYFEAMRAESRISASDVQNDSRASELVQGYLVPLGITAMLDAGIQFDGRLAGVICLEHIGSKRRWHADEEAFASNAAAIVAQIFSGAKRRQAEEEREKLREQLLQIQKMESIGRLAGGVAHDFNNMLGVILGHAELALEKAVAGEPLYADLTQIYRAAKHSADTTRQLLAFARKQTIVPRMLDLNEAIGGALQMLRRLVNEDIELAWFPGDNLGPVKMDPAQVDQILTNLVVNARDAIGDTGRITIETGTADFDEDYCVDHSGFLPGRYVLLAVSDDGCGMDPETLSHLFEPFFTTKAMDKGIGLGMATVYGIVSQNNGFINVYSEPARGTTFKIYLSRQEGEAEPLPQEMPAPLDAACGQATILLVEDQPAILSMTKTMLERFGYEVLTAATPGEAIRLAQEFAGEIQLLITDVIMPAMNGRDLAQKLMSRRPDLKHLFMSGYTANVIAHHGILEEDVHFIQKPFTMQDLAARVKMVLDS